MKVAQQQLWRFYATARSGNHAVICWLANQLNPRPAFLPSVREMARPWKQMSVAHPRTSYENLPRSSSARRDAVVKGKRPVLFESFGNVPLWTITEDDLASNTARLGGARKAREILIIRDPYNWIASYLRWQMDNPPPLRDWERLVHVWRSHALEALGHTHHIRPLVIRYNSWVRDAKYRQEIATSLRIPCTDAGRDIVQCIGGGSSFEQHSLPAAALRERVTKRWREMKIHGFYRWLTRPPWMAKVALGLFGDDPEVRAAAATLEQAL